MCVYIFSKRYSQILVTAADLNIPDLDSLSKCVSKVVTTISMCLAVTQASWASFKHSTYQFQNLWRIWHFVLRSVPSVPRLEC